jgi:hypothetical protein
MLQLRLLRRLPKFIITLGIILKSSLTLGIILPYSTVKNSKLVLQQNTRQKSEFLLNSCQQRRLIIAVNQHPS